MGDIEKVSLVIFSELYRPDAAPNAFKHLSNAHRCRYRSQSCQSVVDDKISFCNLLVVLDVLGIEFLVHIPAIEAHWGHYQKVSPMKLNSDVLILLDNFYFHQKVTLSIISQQIGLSRLLLNLKQLAIVEEHKNGASVGVHRCQLYSMS